MLIMRDADMGARASMSFARAWVSHTRCSPAPGCADGEGGCWESDAIRSGHHVTNTPDASRPRFPAGAVYTRPWARNERPGGDVTLFFDAETGTEIDPVAIDRATGALIGTRHIRRQKDVLSGTMDETNSVRLFDRLVAIRTWGRQCRLILLIPCWPTPPGYRPAFAC
jgi:hypothetical protein